MPFQLFQLQETQIGIELEELKLGTGIEIELETGIELELENGREVLKDGCVGIMVYSFLSQWRWYSEEELHDMAYLEPSAGDSSTQVSGWG